MTPDNEPIKQFWEAYYALSNTFVALEYAISGINILKNPSEAQETRENTK